MTNYQEIVGGFSRAFSPAEVRERAEYTAHNRVQAALSRMVDTGVIKRLGQGVYATAAHTESLAIAARTDDELEFLARFEILVGGPLHRATDAAELLAIRYRSQINQD